MYLMYIDESGDSGVSEKSPTKKFVLSAIVFHELHWNQLLDDLIEFRRHLRKTKELKLREEIHCKDFINSPGDLARIKRNDRLDILKQCIDWIARHKDISVITVVVDKTNKTNDVFELAWERLIQRYENTIEKRNFPCVVNSQERGILLPDNTDGQKLLHLLRKMRRYNPIPDKTGLFSVSGSRNLKLNYIIEDPFMKDSGNSFFTQLVDVVAYCARQLYEPNAYMKKKGAVNFYKRLEPVLNKKVSTKHPLGIVEA